jgi:hypothetical protein
MGIWSRSRIGKVLFSWRILYILAMQSRKVARSLENIHHLKEDWIWYCLVYDLASAVLEGRQIQLCSTCSVLGTHTGRTKVGTCIGYAQKRSHWRIDNADCSH